MLILLSRRPAPRRPRSQRPRARRPVAAAAGALALAALAASGTDPAIAAPTRAAGLPPPPPCANAISIASGTVTTSPTPLPMATSTVGGDRLARPGLQLDAPAAVHRPPALRATAWLVADLGTGTVLASCNAHVPLAPASTLKILTSLSLVHRLNWAARYIGRQEDAATDGTRVGIVPGSTYSVQDLFHGLMLNSGNDAATALAAVAGGMPATTALMNAEARRLGGTDTHAVNDSGLDAPGQVTSAYDLALFGRAALADPLISRLVATKTYRFPGKGNRPPRATFQIQNHNHLLFTYPGATGVKNGYTTAAGGSFVGSATRGGHRYIVTLLRADGSTWQMAKQLLNWAFATGPQVTTGVGRLVDPGEVADPTASPTPTGTTTRTPATPRSAGSGVAALAGSTTDHATSSRSEDARTGWIVISGLAVMLLGGLGLTGARAARSGASAGRTGQSRTRRAGRSRR